MQHIKDLLFSDKTIRIKVDRYLNTIRGKLNEEEQLKVEELKEQIEIGTIKQEVINRIDELKILANVYCDLTGLTIK